MERLHVLGTGYARATRCYNTCFALENSAGDLLLALADTCIAAQNAVVAAESLGIGSCYIGDVIENAEQMRNAAMQDEKNTQDKVHQAQQQPQQKRLRKQW